MPRQIFNPNRKYYSKEALALSVKINQNKARQKRIRQAWLDLDVAINSAEARLKWIQKIQQTRR